MYVVPGSVCELFYSLALREGGGGWMVLGLGLNNKPQGKRKTDKAATQLAGRGGSSQLDPRWISVFRCSGCGRGFPELVARDQISTK